MAVKMRTMRGCCDCDEPCDCEENGPEARFSRSFSSTNPLVINLIDTSVAGDCGEIVQWVWKLDGVQISTQRNPVGVSLNGDGPWAIQLTVTDESGCTDTVAMLIQKPISQECQTATIVLPTAFELDWGTLSNPFNCDDCPELSGPKSYSYASSASQGGQAILHDYRRIYRTSCNLPTDPFDQEDVIRIAVCYPIAIDSVVISVQQANNPRGGFGWTYRREFPRSTNFMSLSSELDNQDAGAANTKRCHDAPATIGIRAL